jgi:transcriptional regulator GlxA family with amidase domain
MSHHRRRAVNPRYKARDRRVSFVVQVLRKQYLDGMPSTAELGKLVNLSSSRLRHVFKNETGMSLGTYVRSLRFANARRLLQKSFLSVKEIAGLVGYSDVSHFVRSYKIIFRERPSETRTRSSRPRS